MEKYGAKANAWAIVTGASDGIGKGFARVLGKRGFNVVLVARNPDKLNEVAASIEKDYKVSTQVVIADCSDLAPETFNKIYAAVGDREVGILVNNVGINTAYPTPFGDQTDREIDGMINTNVHFHAKLTKKLLPILQRRRSAILHLSSFSALFPAALMPIYSATKSFDDVFSRALAPELKKMGIDSVSVVAHYVVSAMSGFYKPKWDVPMPETFAAATLDKIGYAAQIVPFWAHDFMARIISLFPQDFVANQTFGMMKTAREKLIARAKKQKEKDSKANQ
jgi:17beta-estradiol 17-dehydrogenase / very-long-chain 3-oxoacyl-CoA reductase